MIDERIIKVTISIGDELRTYTDLAITATGTKFANPNQGECNITIENLSKSVRDYIVTETTPFNKNRKRKSIKIEIGRKSYGTSVLYVGDIFRSQSGTIPDNVLTLRCLTGQFMKGNIVSRTGQSQESVKSIAQGIALDNGLDLTFSATDKKVSNYSFTGAALDQIEKLLGISGKDVYVDGNRLIVKEINSSISNDVFLINKNSGMKTPQFTEQGVKIEFLYDPRIILGSAIRVSSELTPAANGDYVIYKLEYNVSNRDAPFHLIAECRRL